MTANSTKTFASILIVLGSAIGCESIAGQTAETPVMLLTEERNFDLKPQDENHLKALQSDPATVSVKLLKLNPAAIRSKFLALSFDNQEKMVGVAVAMDNKDGAHQWYGHLEKTEDEVVLTVRNERCTGVIRSKGKVYAVRPLGDSFHAIVEQDPSKMPPDHPPAFKDVIERSPREKPKSDPNRDQAQVAPGATKIRLLMMYTALVRTEITASGGTVAGLVDSAIANANNSFRDSGILVELTVPHLIEVSYLESGLLATDVEKLVSPNDNVLDEIHKTRRDSKADIGVLLVAKSDGAGYAATILATPANAFAVVDYRHADSNLTLAHEVGHLMGARHNPENDATNSPFAYGHGYRLQAKGWRCVMSYPPQFGPQCIRIGRWSNPRLMLKGDPTGTAALHDNARVLNETRETVATFRN